MSGTFLFGHSVFNFVRHIMIVKSNHLQCHRCRKNHLGLLYRTTSVRRLLTNHQCLSSELAPVTRRLEEFSYKKTSISASSGNRTCALFLLVTLHAVEKTGSLGEQSLVCRIVQLLIAVSSYHYHMNIISDVLKILKIKTHLNRQITQRVNDAIFRQELIIEMRNPNVT